MQITNKYLTSEIANYGRNKKFRHLSIFTDRDFVFFTTLMIWQNVNNYISWFRNLKLISDSDQWTLTSEEIVSNDVINFRFWSLIWSESEYRLFLHVGLFPSKPVIIKSLEHPIIRRNVNSGFLFAPRNRFIGKKAWRHPDWDLYTLDSTLMRRDLRNRVLLVTETGSRFWRNW